MITKSTTKQKRSTAASTKAAKPSTDLPTITAKRYAAPGLPPGGLIVDKVPLRRRTLDELTPFTQQIIADYGEPTLLSFRELMAKYHATYATLRQFLVQHKIPVRVERGRPKGKHWEGYAKQAKVSPEQRAWILQEDLKGTFHKDIAAKVGITKEAVRLICLAAGHVPRRMRTTVHDAQPGAPATAKPAGPRPEAIKASEMWKAGQSTEEIAAVLGVKPGSLSVQLTRWRKRFPDLFPRRYQTEQGVLETDPTSIMKI